MPALPHLLTVALSLSPVLKYGTVLILSIIEGPFVFLLSGVLLHYGVFSLVPLLLALIIGDLIGDTLWYLLGYRYGTTFISRFGKYFGVTEESVRYGTGMLKKYHEVVLILSKVTNGLGLAIAVLIAAGMAKIPYSRFIIFNAIGEIIWTSILLAVGYYLTVWYEQINTVIGRLGLAGAFLLAVALFVGWVRYVRTKTRTTA